MKYFIDARAGRTREFHFETEDEAEAVYTLMRCIMVERFWETKFTFELQKDWDKTIAERGE